MLLGVSLWSLGGKKMVRSCEGQTGLGALLRGAWCPGEPCGKALQGRQVAAMAVSLHSTLQDNSASIALRAFTLQGRISILFLGLWAKIKCRISAILSA